MAKTLILGGARSGKSAYAMRAAENVAGAKRRVIIVTAEAGDAEMAARIAHHKAERGERWQTVEAPLALPEAIATLKADDAAVVDCLTLWITNLLLRGDDMGVASAALCNAVKTCPAGGLPASLTDASLLRRTDAFCLRR